MIHQQPDAAALQPLINAHPLVAVAVPDAPDVTAPILPVVAPSVATNSQPPTHSQPPIPQVHSLIDVIKKQ